MKVAVFCPNLIGDTVMATPAFRALRRGLPDAILSAVIKPRVAPALEGTSWFDEMIPLDPASSAREERMLAVVKRLRRPRFDVAVLFPNSIRSAWIAWLANIPRRIGYVRHGRGLLLTDRLHFPIDSTGRRLPTPIVESYLKLARRLGCPVDSIRTELATTSDDEASADSAWSELGLLAGSPVVCLNTGGAYGPAKSWPTAYFAELANRLAREVGVSVLVLCGPAERALAREIACAAGHPRVVSLADRSLSIGLTKACIRRSALLITTDSGPRHFAAPFDIPVITLFGPTHVSWTRTYHPRAWNVLLPVPCGPCQRPVCPEGHHRCMRELTSDNVFRVALRALQGTAIGMPRLFTSAE
jgi:heptosyltransferase-2